MKQVHLYGKPLEDGKTVQVDHCVQTFTIVIRSMSGIGASDIRDQLQKKWEVTNITEGDGTMYVS